MSVKVGAKFVAGNLALKVQDRLFYAKEVMENGKEYYDVIVPEGASLGFTQATKLALIIQGTNKTTTPILRYKSNEFQIVGGSFNATAPIKLGELRDGGLAEMYMGTSMKHIYLAANENSYDQIRNTPIFVDRDGDQIPLLGGPVNYDTLHLPYLKNKVLVLDSEDFLKITTAGFEYGWQDYTRHHTFLSGDRLEWKKSVNETYELATTKDIEQLVIGNTSKGVLTYGRKTKAEMEAITDMEQDDTCLCIEDTTIYKYEGSGWVVRTKLEWGQEQNGWFYEVEDCDGTHSGRAIWNWIEEHGQFETFIDYVNGIDNYSITRNSDGSMQVSRLLHTLKLKVSIPGMATKEITFDGLEDRVLEINTTLSDYYTKTEIDSYYNDNIAGRLVEFYQEGSNVKLHNLDITKANLVLDMGSGYLKANDVDIDASRIKYTKAGITSSVKTFLDKNFAFYDIVNDFIPGQTIDGKLIATEDWVEDYADNTFMPNKFNLELLTNLQLVLDAPSATKTSLRFSTINLNTGDREDNDIELPVVNAHNNGLVTPDQMNLWDTVTTKTPLVNTQGQLESAIHYQDNTPRVTTTTSTQKAGLEIVNGEELL